MKRLRIAVLGDTALVENDLNDAGAIAIELARSGQVDVGLRSVATDAHALDEIGSRLRSQGVCTWLTARDHPPSLGDQPVHADLRMGDPIDIGEIFDHDVVVLASRDVRLRRFLSDLPVHTRPDVRILALLHFEDGVPQGERVEDLLRFDAITGSENDFGAWGRASEPLTGTGEHPSVLRHVHARMHGANTRAMVSWACNGTATLAEPLEDIIAVAAGDARPRRERGTPWAAFVSTLAVGMARRQPYPEVTRLASAAFISRLQSAPSQAHSRILSP